MALGPGPAPRILGPTGAKAITSREFSRGMASYELVDEPDRLQPALKQLDDRTVVGVDVERADGRRYYRSAALVQVGAVADVLLVDPLSLPDLGPLDAFLHERTTVLHALENDLGPLATLGVRPPLVQDTALAATVLGLPTGLERLLADLLGVELGGDKAAMQRADWEQRPLPEAMLAYAAGDVAHLPALWADLERRLDETGRKPWYREELAAALARPPADERRAWTRTRGASRLSPRARARLRSLWHSREDLARTTDTAPSRIAGDKVLLDLAVRPPESAAQLGRRGLRRQAVRDFGDDLMAAITAAESVDPEPPRRGGRAPTDADRETSDRLRVLRSERAAALGLDPGFLCPSRAILAALLTDPETPEEFRDALGLRRWQWEQVGAAFCETVGIDGPGRPPPPADKEGSPDG